MALLHCHIEEGPRQGFKTIGVASVEGHSEYLTIEEKFLVKRGEDRLLAVKIIGKDPQQKIVLVQLPYEADSGANRVWVKSEALFTESSEVLS